MAKVAASESECALGAGTRSTHRPDQTSCLARRSWRLRSVPSWRRGRLGGDCRVWAHQTGWFKRWLPLPNGIPSHDTFRRVFLLLDTNAFAEAFRAWVQSIAQLAAQQGIAIDGKTLRRSHDAAEGQSAISMVSAWATANRLVLGQLKVDDKSNEITAIPELLRVLELTWLHRHD